MSEKTRDEQMDSDLEGTFDEVSEKLDRTIELLELIVTKLEEEFSLDETDPRAGAILDTLETGLNKTLH